jgi:hypothetical protein
MTRWLLGSVVGVVAFAGLLAAQDGILRARVKKADAESQTVTLTVGGQDREFAVTEETQLRDGQNRPIAGRLKDPALREGAEVLFKAERRGGRDVLIGMKLRDAAPAAPAAVKFDSSHFKPLTELGAGEYQGFPGGLYTEGRNDRPAAHEAAGLALAKHVKPLDRDGNPSPDGKIVLLSVGMSNTAQASQGFQRLLTGERDVNPHVVFVNGSQGGMTAAATQDPDDGRTGTRFWTTVGDRLKAAGVTRAQVQAAWIKQADAGPNQGFPAYARKLQAELTKIVQVLPARFPNVKLTYLSSRSYGGYATTPLNPEPYAYESGFSVKWLIEAQIKGDAALNFDPAKGSVRAPWLSWGPYLWANGPAKRSDGFSADREDFAPGDGTHESPSGQAKVGRLLLDFFKTDATTRPWFVRGSTN